MALVDAHQRPLRDLRISVTDRCNFRCTYCMPREHFGPEHAFLERRELLTYEEICTVVAALLPTGLEKVRLTGGEPLLRRDLIEFIRMLRTLAPQMDLAMTTNGVLLEKQAPALVQAGLDRVTVSLDALDKATFQTMADTDAFQPDDILRGIDAALKAGLKVKVNTVVRKGMNEHQIVPIAQACTERDIPLRFIEFMDVGTTNAWDLREVVSGEEIRSIITTQIGPLTPLAGQPKSEVARRYHTENGQEFGFINSVTEPFCGSCTRARLSANGSLYTCLFASEGHDVKSLIRMGASEKDVQNAVRSIWNRRDDTYSLERAKSKDAKPKVEMSFIGG